MRTKHVLLIALIAAGFAFFGACKSAPAPVAAPQEDLDLSFDNVYSKYQDRLILDGATDYVVQQDEWLTKIARKFYGSEKEFGVANAYFFPLIMLASNEEVNDPDLIVPGMRLTIPDLRKNLDNADARQMMKEFFTDIAAIYEQKAHDAISANRPSRRQLAEETQQNLLYLVQSL
ncbi:hypothetical protein AGMMS49940_08270 [Spirochaetia bacterium]|nr:hypothetical protein AGMMS49940_08270 [Spirochaetia bacterium]